MSTNGESVTSFELVIARGHNLRFLLIIYKGKLIILLKEIIQNISLISETMGVFSLVKFLFVRLVELIVIFTLILIMPSIPPHAKYEQQYRYVNYKLYNIACFSMYPITYL